MLDNGGPPLDDAAPKLRWIKLNIAEFLEGIDELTYEQRGFYITALLKMYARHDGIPEDDRDGAHAMGCNPRTFRLHKASLLDAGKFYVADGMLRNKRFDYELAEFTRQAKKRREAALKRERERREAITAYTTEKRSAPIRADFEPNSSPIRAEFTPNSVPKNAENPTKSTCAAQKVWREPELEPEPELESKKKNPASHLDAEDALACLNGIKVEMVDTMARWMNNWAPDNKAAELWLQTSIGLYGAETVKRGFGELRAKMAQGDVVGRPIPLFAKICERIKADGVKKGKTAMPSRLGRFSR
jgi:uncharacterized protein YdaU (DUF1376 family)